MNSETNPDPTEMFNMFKFFPIIMILYMGVFLWLVLVYCNWITKKSARKRNNENEEI